jgi:hypothetical protein
MNFWGYGVFAWQRKGRRKWSFMKLASLIFTPLEFASRQHMHLVFVGNLEMELESKNMA